MAGGGVPWDRIEVTLGAVVADGCRSLGSFTGTYRAPSAGYERYCPFERRCGRSLATRLSRAVSVWADHDRPLIAT